jgi:hypothetical protein
MRGAQEGERNHTLYRTARRAHDLIQAGHLTESALSQLTQAAAGTGLPPHEIKRIMQSARSPSQKPSAGDPSAVRSKDASCQGRAARR